MGSQGAPKAEGRIAIAWAAKHCYARRDPTCRRQRGSPLKGFLGTAAPLYADLVLIIEICMGMALLAGAVLARMRKFRAHACCQSAVVLINFVTILVVMIPSFHSHVAPTIPLRLGRSYYALATAHAAVGTVAECGGVYILLAAGTKLLPKKLRITRYELWMRCDWQFGGPLCFWESRHTAAGMSHN